MKKVLIIMILLVSTALQCHAATLTVDGEKMDFSNKIIVNNGISYMPVREYFENNGFIVNWDAAEDNIDVTTNHLPISDSERSFNRGQ